MSSGEHDFAQLHVDGKRAEGDSYDDQRPGAEHDDRRDAPDQVDVVEDGEDRAVR